MITIDDMLDAREIAARGRLAVDPNDQFAHGVLERVREERARRQADAATLAEIADERARTSREPNDVFNLDDAQAMVEIAAKQHIARQLPKHRKRWNGRPDLLLRRAQILLLVYRQPGIHTPEVAAALKISPPAARRALLWLRDGEMVYDQNVQIGSRHYSEWYPETEE